MASNQHLFTLIIIVFFVLIMLTIVIIVPSYVNPVRLTSLAMRKVPHLNSKYRSVVSLNIPSYLHNTLDRRFACSGVIITQKWILVGDDCFVHRIDWLNLQVRAGSELWSRGGTQHNVIKLLRLFKDGPAVLNIDPPFLFNEHVEPIKLVRDGTLEWSNAYCIHWYNANQRKKNEYLAEIWSKYPCHYDNKKGIMKEFLSVFIKPISSPLLTSEGVLVGFKLGVNIHNGFKLYAFLDLQNGEYKTWLEQLISTGEPLENVDDFEDNLNFTSTILLYNSNRRCLSTTTETSQLKI